MSKVAIVYWTGTGNTEAMANALADGVKKSGNEADVFEVESFDKGSFDSYDGFAFGCPAMGDEVLEESTFEPFFADIEADLKDKPVVLFGSYGWGGGAWMRDWEERVKNDGAKLFGDGIDIENDPSDDDVAHLEEVGENFAKSL